MSKVNATSIQKRVLAAMKYWDSQRLRSELEAYILSDSDDALEEQFFDDIATEEEHKAGKLLR